MLEWTSKHCCGRTNFPNCNGHVKGKSVADEILLPGHNEMLLSQVKRISQKQVLLLKSMSTFSATLEKQCLSNDASQLSQMLEEPLKRSNSVYICPDNITIKSQFWT